ncbi:MAG: DUF1761 domain-containing protein [Ignavibacteria bacterium]|nr:DUF1761 domain-containing protein [Ignavibacteria bacterium]
MPDPTLNLVPVVVAGVLNMIVGALWYSPYVIGKLWMRAMGKTEEELRQGFSPTSMAMTYIVNTIASLVFAYVLAHLIKFSSTNDFTQGVMIGFWVWLGFVVTTVIPGYMYEGKPKILFFLFIIYQLVSITLMGGLLAIW